MTEIGKLYIVATPIGNLDDITLRALQILSTVDLIAAEDTRHTAKLLSRHHIRTRLISCHEYNEFRRVPELIRQIENGASIALVSDAGTPTVSDPGYRLINQAIVQGIEIIPIPGVSAAITALSAAGLPSDSFIFVGFPAKKKDKRIKELEKLSELNRTIIFYESPKRISALIDELFQVMGDRQAVLARELTKIHEEFIRGALSEILQKLNHRSVIKGECTLLVTGCELPGEKVTTDDLSEKIRLELMKSDISVSDLAKQLSAQYGISKQTVYNEALMIKKELKDESG